MWSDILWLDFEVFGGVDLKAAGTFRYVDDPATRAFVLAYAVGDAPARTWHSHAAILDWDDAPRDLRAAFDRGAIIAAWNASFDAAVWNYATLGFPFLAPEQVIDVMVQAGVSNLPTDLESASRALGGTGKQKDGKKLIRLFSIDGADPRAHLAEWERFLAYARQDVEAMRDVYRCTRPLPREEWQQYWAFEHINRRGVMVDVPFVHRAAALTGKDAGVIGRRLAELTGGIVISVGRVKSLAAWLYDQLADTAMREVLMVGCPDNDDEDSDEEPELSLTRDRIARVLAMLDAKRTNGSLTAGEARAFEAATLRLYGGGTSPKKFARLVAQQVDGVLRGQYRFAGAGQTGRLSSRGAQIHNLVRDALDEHGGDEAALVDMIADGGDYAALAAAKPVDMPVARKLALLIRPALVAAPGKVFVLSDFSMVEARVNPWLANSPDAERVLDVFRAHDADPSRPDLYTITTADILHRNDLSGISKSERQTGKVATLSLGFGGAVGALKQMALNYRVNLDDDEARRIVDTWREANPWARAFWSAIWDAAIQAWELPGTITTAGRVAFVYRSEYLGGSLFMALPSGRLLTYPRPKWRDVDVLDKDKKPTGEKRRELSFRRAHGRAKLWFGTIVENAVQGTAADLLRETVTRLETDPALTSFMPIRMTTHDEIVCEVDKARAEEAKAILRREMLTLPKWAAGLPLQSEETVRAYYSKVKDKTTP
jgi:DNA polymerase bacteriophage-type